MLCNTKHEALSRIHYLAEKAVSAPCSELLKEIIKLEVKDHIINWGINKEEILNFTKEVA
jgi:hypothetical protein